MEKGSRNAQAHPQEAGFAGRLQQNKQQILCKQSTHLPAPSPFRLRFFLPVCRGKAVPATAAGSVSPIPWLSLSIATEMGPGHFSKTYSSGAHSHVQLPPRRAEYTHSHTRMHTHTYTDLRAIAQRPCDTTGMRMTVTWQVLKPHVGCWCGSRAKMKGI